MAFGNNGCDMLNAKNKKPSKTNRLIPLYNKFGKIMKPTTKNASPRRPTIADCFLV